MPKQRNHDSADFNAKVALAAMKGQHTVNELAASFGVHPNPVLQWKKQALEAGSDTRRLLCSARAGVARRRDMKRSTVPADRSTHSRVGLAQNKSWTLGLRSSDSSWSRSRS